ncbi:hypothetical protein FK529_05685 [Tsukamurella asaccharolytica]|uniref:Uncharacterized protein n=1 Tax=Tsukamurella asaccharolytica TaxID=2592067 RepID=A0A5C5REF1_9ACTN|nr:hypothetical protein [Tsukamurella asaccharolytica]TWS20813.1 hypothetical protein FK529_05685 [Tsukamurella asaccharolytica]
MSAADLQPQDVVRTLDHIAGLFTSLDAVQADISALQDAERGLKEQIKAALGEEGTVGTIGGKVVVTYRPSAPASQLDGKALRADHPELFDKYLVEKRPSRPFKVLD